MTVMKVKIPKPVLIAAALSGLALLTTGVSQLYAHHAFGAEFDPNLPVLLKGPLVRIEWINPHTWFHVEVTKKDGAKEIWMVEGGTPNSLLRRGLKRDTLKPGQVVIVDGYQAKDRSNRANGRDVTLPDGQKFFLGSSGTGAPYDAPGKDQRKDQ
jgi:hypothetical protein